MKGEEENNLEENVKQQVVEEDDESEEEEAPQQESESQQAEIRTIALSNAEVLRDMLITPLQRVTMMDDTLKQFKIIIPKVLSSPVELVPSKLVTEHQKNKAYERFAYQKLVSHRNVNQSLKFSNILFFPHKNLVQYDCGKLQELARLLKRLHS